MNNNEPRTIESVCCESVKFFRDNDSTLEKPHDTKQTTPSPCRRPQSAVAFVVRPSSRRARVRGAASERPRRTTNIWRYSEQAKRVWRLGQHLIRRAHLNRENTRCEVRRNRFALWSCVGRKR